MVGSYVHGHAYSSLIRAEECVEHPTDQEHIKEL